MVKNKCDLVWDYWERNIADPKEEYIDNTNYVSCFCDYVENMSDDEFEEMWDWSKETIAEVRKACVKGCGVYVGEAQWI